MTDNIEKKVAVDGPVANEGEHGSSPFSPGQVSPADPLGFGQRWTVARKREVVLRLLRGEPMELMSRQFGVEIFRLEQWREKAIAGIEAALKDRSVAALPVTGKDALYWDRDFVGFGVRVQRNGRKVYVVQSRGPAGLRRVTLGPCAGVAINVRRRQAATIIDRIMLFGAQVRC